MAPDTRPTKNNFTCLKARRRHSIAISSYTTPLIPIMDYNNNNISLCCSPSPQCHSDRVVQIMCPSRTYSSNITPTSVHHNKKKWRTGRYILLALLSLITLASAGELDQSVFRPDSSSPSMMEASSRYSALPPQSSHQDLDTSRLDIASTSTGPNQVFSTFLASSGTNSEVSSSDESSSAPWQLPGSRTEDVDAASLTPSPSSSLPATEKLEFEPSRVTPDLPKVTSSVLENSMTHGENIATSLNEIGDDVSGKTVSHLDRFQPTSSEAVQDEGTGDITSSEVIRLARSIGHSATASISSNRQMLGKAVESGERPSDEKTIPLPNITREKPVASVPGEARRAPRVEHAAAAVGPLAPPHLQPLPRNQNWTTAINATARRSEPDIQDIITGIVKLLGGNVNVAAVQGPPPPHSGRPLRPLGTRINNRGPPRITDVVFESTSTPAPPANTTPASSNVLTSTKQPPPYPFDRPPPPPFQHIPFPGMEDSESFMSPPPPPGPIGRPGMRPPVRPGRPRPPPPNRRPIYPDGPHLLETTTPETSALPPSEEPSNTTQSTASSSESSPDTTSSSVTTSSTTEHSPPTTPELPLTEGVGVASPVHELESSIPELVSTASSSATPEVPLVAPSSSSSGVPSRPPYVARPGLVLDDPEFKPGAANNVPIITAPIRGHLPPGHGEIFDVTVTAVQGPGNLNTGRPQIYQVPLNPRPGTDVITSPAEGQDYVSIDGKRTYINLFPTEAEKGGEATAATGGPLDGHLPLQRPTGPQRPFTPTPASGQQQQQLQQQQGDSQGPVIGTGSAVADPSAVPRPGGAAQPSKSPQQPPGRRRPTYPRRPPVRIDTCIVGDSSTCDEAQNEACRTEAGVSSCHCRPGYSRRKHRDTCRRVVSVMVNLRVDRIYETRATWSAALSDPESEDYQQLEWESVRAFDSAMGMTPFSDEFMGARVNGFLKLPPGKDGSSPASGLAVNATLLLAETAETARAQLKQDIQRHLLGVITRRNNNVGESALWVDKPPGAVSALQDVDECSSSDLNDCHPRAHCTNVFGTFRCSCMSGLRDPWAGNVQRSGRTCEACPAEHCNNRGECSFQPGGERVCTCSGNYYGSQCELDGEVLGVAIGATVAAVLIIGLTLLGLCMWSRRWNREQQKAEMMSTRTGITSPVFSYMAAAAAASSAASVKSGLPPPGAPASYVSVEDRLRWAHIADVMAQNHYAVQQPEPGTRPSSAVFGGYPSLTGTLPHMSLTMQHPLQPLRPPPPPLQGPPSSSDDEDQRDLLGRNFHVPRPRSRAASVANQSGIYYDLDYDTRPTPIPAPRSTLPRPPQSPPPIPMATYMQQGRFFRN